jgi:hypothetical protein
MHLGQVQHCCEVVSVDILAIRIEINYLNINLFLNYK